MSYNEIMVAQAKSRVLRELEDSGRVGKTTETKITVDNSGERFDLTDAGAYYVKVSDEAMSLSNVTHIDAVDPISGEMFTLTRERIIYQKGDGMEVVGVNVDEGQLGYLFSGQVGEFYGTFALYTVCAFYTKTITPIKPEHLPGVCLPVVDARHLNMLLGDALDPDNQIVLDKASETFTPIILIANIDNGNIFSGVCAGGLFNGMTQYLLQSPTGGAIGLTKNPEESDPKWTIAYIPPAE